MNKNSTIEKRMAYVSPSAEELAFESEGVLCGSDVDGGFGGGVFEPDPDAPFIDF
jgi:hypothetical protein